MLIPFEGTITLTKPDDVHNLLQNVLENESPADRDQEHFWVIHLTSRNTVKSLHLVSLGTLNSTLVHPREVFTRAISERCSNIIVAHNHPSNDVSPSKDDLQVTQRLVEAGKLLKVEVLDHLITAATGYYSFNQHGCL